MTNPPLPAARRWGRTRLLLQALLPAFLTLSSEPARAQTPGFPIGINIDVSQAGSPARAMLTGHNTPWVYDGEALFANGAIEPRMFELARVFQAVPFRYPGGEYADSYDWLYGVGPAPARSPLSFYQSSSSNELSQQVVTFGTDEFREYCRQLACVPILQLNLHQGTRSEVVARALDWRQYVNAQVVKGPTGEVLPKVIHWELGNEPYLKDRLFFAPDGSTEANALYLSPAEFAVRADQVMTALAQADPTVKFILPFALDTWTGLPYCPPPGGPNCSSAGSVVGDQLGYAKTLFDTLSAANLARIDALGLHYYLPQVGPVADANGVPADVRLYWATMAGTETVRRNLAAVRSFWAKHPRTRTKPLPHLSVTEFNSMYTIGTTAGQELPQDRYTDSQTGALFVADMIRLMAYEPNVSMGAAWSLSRNGVFGAITFNEDDPDFPVFARPHYLASAWGQELLHNGTLLRPTLKVQTTNAHAKSVGQVMPYPAMPLATAAATRSKRRLKVLVLNKDIGTVGNVRLTIRNGEVTSATVKQVDASAQFAVREDGPVSSVQQFIFTGPYPAPTYLGFTATNGRSVLMWDMPRGSFALVELTLK